MRQTRSFFVDGKYYEIPEDEVEEFLSGIGEGEKVQNAVQYDVDGKTYNIPEADEQEFLGGIGENETAVKNRGFVGDDGQHYWFNGTMLDELASNRRNQRMGIDSEADYASRGKFAAYGIPESFARDKASREQFVDGLVDNKYTSFKPAPAVDYGEIGKAEDYPTNSKLKLGPDIGGFVYNTIGKPLDYLKTSTEANYGRDVSNAEAVAANLPFIGSVMDANENRKEEVLKRLYTGDYRDTLERNKLALSIGMEIPQSSAEISLPDEPTMNVPIDEKTQDDEIRRAAGRQFADRLIARQKKGQRLNKIEMNELQKILTEGAGLVKNVPEMVNPATAAATIGPAMMNRATNLNRGEWAVGKDGSPYQLDVGDGGDLSMMKGLAGAAGERLVWMNKLPGSGKVAKTLGDSFVGKNTAQLLDMAAKGDITDFLDNVVGLGIPEAEMKKTVEEWAEEHLLPQNIAKDIIKAAPAHFMMKGAKMLTPSGREQYRAEVAAKEAREAAQKRAEEAAKENARAEAKARYDANLSEEAMADIDNTVGVMIKNEVVPSWRHAEEVKRRAIEKIGNRENGESHEVVEQAVMEAAQEVQAELMEPARVTSPALERRQTEAKARENERWAKRSDELAAEYSQEEAAQKLLDEQAAANRETAANEIAGAEHDAKQADLEAAFENWKETAVKKQKARKSGKAVKDETPATPKEQAAAESFEDFVRKDPKMIALDKEWQNAKDAADKGDVEYRVRERFSELKDEWAKRNAANETKPAEAEKPADKPIETPTEAAKTDTAMSKTDNAATTADTPAENSIVTKNEKVSQSNNDAGFRAWAVDRNGKPMEFATPEDEAASRKVFDDLVKAGKIDGATGKKITKPIEAETPPTEDVKPTKPTATTKEPLAVEATKPVEATKDVKVEPNATATTPATDPLKAATALLGADAYLPAKDLRAKVSQWEKHAAAFAGERKDKLLKQIEAAKTILAAKRSEVGKKGAVKTEDVKDEKADGGYTPSKELIEAKSRIEAMPTFTSHNKSAKKKAQKDWLLSSIDDAIKSHGDTRTLEGKPYSEKFADEFESLLRRRNATLDFDKLDKLKEQIQAATDVMSKGDLLTFEVPDDGTFSIRNNPEALAVFKRMIQKRLSPANLKEGSLVKAEKPLIEDIKSAGIGDEVKGAETPNTNRPQMEVSDTSVAMRANDPKRRSRAEVSSGDPAAPEKGSIADTIEELDRLIAEEEAGLGTSGDNKPANAPAGNINRSHQWTHGQGVSAIREFFGGLKSRNSIIHKAKTLFPEFAFRGETTKKIGKNYNGYWKSWQELIRSKDTAAIDTIPHEIGHGIDSLTRKGGLITPPQAAKRELMKLGRQLYGNKRPNGGYMGEGFAEYIRGRLTAADNLETECPNLHKWFNEDFVKNEKGRKLLARVDQLANEVTMYKQQSNIQKFAAFMRPSVGIIEKTVNAAKSVFSQEFWNDEGATLTKAYEKSNLSDLHHWQPKFKDLESEIKKNGRSTRAIALAKEISEQIESDPRLFASNARGTSSARTIDMFENGATDIYGINRIGNVVGFRSDGTPIRDNITESPKEIFSAFSSKELADWKKYAAAKVGLENYVNEGREFGYPRRDLEDIVRTLETPKFENALQRFSDFTRRTLSVGLECGAITPEQYLAIVGAHKYYVRTERRFDENSSGMGNNQQNPIHKIKGSQRNIFDPIMATMMQTERQLRYFQTQKVLQLIGKDVLKAEKLNMERENGNPSGVDYHIAANVPIRVANAQEAVKFTSEKLKKDFLERASRHLEGTGAAQQGVFVDRGNKLMTQAESMALDLYEGMYGDKGDTLTVFRERPSNGKNGVVSTYIDGKLVTFEIPDAAWQKYITGMETGGWQPKEWWSKAIWGATTLPAKTLRAGATLLNPGFVVPNASRDTVHAAVMSDSNTNIPVVNTIRGIVEMSKKNGVSDLWHSMGGETSMMLGSKSESMWNKALNNAFAMNGAEKILNGFDPRSPRSYLNPIGGVVKAWADLLSIPETAPRINEMKMVMDRAKSSGLTNEAAAILAFANGKDISIDYGKHGTAMKYINQTIPFVGAWYRGLEQFSRNMGITKTLPHQFTEGEGIVNTTKKIIDGNYGEAKDAALSTAKRAGKTTAKALAWITIGNLANALAKMATMTDDERRAEFRKVDREKWDYTDYFGVRIAQPFELGSVFSALPKAVVYQAYGDKDAVKNCLAYIIESNLGKYTSAEDIATGVTLFGPWVDILRNKKWDDSPVVSPQIKNSMEKKDWSDYSTTEIAKWIGEKMDWAPAHFDHIANTWTGGMWKRLLSPASDSIGQFATGISSFKPRPLARRDVNDFYSFAEDANRSYNSGTISATNLGKLARAEKLKDELSPMFKEIRELPKRYSDHGERNKKRMEIMEKVFDLIQKFEKEDKKDYELGLEKAVASLTNQKVNNTPDSVATKNKAILNQVDMAEAIKAIRRYGRRNGWSKETISKRIQRLRIHLKPTE